jgi:hypothetical protein
MAVTVPPNIRLEMVDWVERLFGDQTLGHAKRHRRIVCPLAGFQVEWPASNHVGQRLE